jgi:hypothetical protein
MEFGMCAAVTVMGVHACAAARITVGFLYHMLTTDGRLDLCAFLM